MHDDENLVNKMTQSGNSDHFGKYTWEEVFDCVLIGPIDVLFA